jgi:hypothetical protein
MTRDGTRTPAIVADDRRIPETETELVARVAGLSGRLGPVCRIP